MLVGSVLLPGAARAQTFRRRPPSRRPRPLLRLAAAAGCARARGADRRGHQRHHRTRRRGSSERRSGGHNHRHGQRHPGERCEEGSDDRGCREPGGQNQIAINFVWTLVTGFLVMFMQAGFAIVETGLTRAKNANHTMMMNFMVYGVGMLAYWLIGFAIQEGGVGAVANLGGTARFSAEQTMTLFGKTVRPLGQERLLPDAPRAPMTSASW